MKAVVLLLCLVGMSFAHICVKGRASSYVPKSKQACGYNEVPASDDFNAILKQGFAIQQYANLIYRLTFLDATGREEQLVECVTK
jgi:hypothetical protein